LFRSYSKRNLRRPPANRARPQQPPRRLCLPKLRTLRLPLGRTLSRANIEQQKSNIIQCWRTIRKISTRYPILAWFIFAPARSDTPNNDFLLTTLGIVHYRESKFDEALKELRKAIEINPNSATAHNYLGITASQKGHQEA